MRGGAMRCERRRGRTMRGVSRAENRPACDSMYAMKKRIAPIVLLFAGSIAGSAAELTGYVIDEKCAAKPAMKGNEACARKCLKDGSPAVLLTADAKIYKLDDQTKATEHAGHKVKVVGTLRDRKR